MAVSEEFSRYDASASDVADEEESEAAFASSTAALAMSAWVSSMC